MTSRRPQSQGHRSSQCLRHPTPTPATGFCPTCLCERLAGVESSPVCRAASGIPLVGDQLFRSRSSSAATCAAASINYTEPRRNSCDARARSTLVDLFNSGDARKGPEKELGLETREIRVCEGENENVASLSSHFEAETELRTVREFIDLELQSKRSIRRDSKGFWDLSARLRKWRRNEKAKKQGVMEDEDNRLRRKSCDLEPKVSVDCIRNSFDEPRASLDGYLLGRTYRLTPMVSVLEDTEIIHSHGGFEKKEPPELPRRVATVDKLSSQSRGGASSNTANGKVSLNPRELFYEAKLVITERELMEWNSKIIKEDAPMATESATKNIAIDRSASIPATSDQRLSEKSQRWWSIQSLMRT